MSGHPYQTLPDAAFWRRAVAQPKFTDVDPVGQFGFVIERATRVATAGSCFAQHIARYLKRSGFNYYVAEPGHPILPASVRERNNYGVFSARYGNIYTARQLLQLFKRASGEFTPQEPAWRTARGSILDPFRPTTQPGGYLSEAEMLADRNQHLAYVREMFRSLDVFVFTLGLTECWRSKIDGAVFPVCPGVEGGEFSDGRYEFYNQTVADVVSDLSEFMALLGQVNAAAKVILTVSPVPLVATAEKGAHVLTATTYSKSVLRVAAAEICAAHAGAHYFPSFEIVTGSYNRGAYFADDLRNVVEDGVAHVMRLFLRHATSDSIDSDAGAVPVSERRHAKHLDIAQKVVDVECDEVSLDRL